MGAIFQLSLTNSFLHKKPLKFLYFFNIGPLEKTFSSMSPSRSDCGTKAAVLISKTARKLQTIAIIALVAFFWHF